MLTVFCCQEMRQVHSVVMGSGINDDVKFKQYLLGELFWELEQHEPFPADFVGVDRDSIEVLMYRGHDDLRIRIAGKVYDVHLTWKKVVPPTIRRL